MGIFLIPLLPPSPYMPLHQEAATECVQLEATQAVLAAPPTKTDVASPTQLNLVGVYEQVLNEKTIFNEKGVLLHEDEDEEPAPDYASLYITALSHRTGHNALTAGILFIPIYGIMLARIDDLVSPLQRTVCMFTIGLDIFAMTTALSHWARIRRAKKDGTAEQFGKVLMERGPGWRYRYIPLAFDIPYCMCMSALVGLFMEVMGFVWYHGKPQEMTIPWTQTEMRLEYASDIIILAPLCMFSTYVVGHAFRVHQARVKAAAAGPVVAEQV